MPQILGLKLYLGLMADKALKTSTPDCLSSALVTMKREKYWAQSFRQMALNLIQHNPYKHGLPATTVSVAGYLLLHNKYNLESVYG